MTDTTTVEPPVQTEATDDIVRINKTNIANALHHYKMAKQSLDRAAVLVLGMSKNENGAGEAMLAAWGNHEGAERSIEGIGHMLNGIEDQRKAFFG